MPRPRLVVAGKYAEPRDTAQMMPPGMTQANTITATTTAPSTFTVTAPIPAPSQDSPPDSGLASLPAFSRRRSSAPTTEDPDPIPADADGQGAAAAEQVTPTSIPAFFRQRARSYSKVAETLLKAAGGWLNQGAGGGSEAFLPDDDDLSTIPPPLGRLAARRIKIGADPEQLSDVEDIAAAAIGVVVWLAKGLSAMWEAKREKRRLEDGRAVYNEAGEHQQ